MAEFHLHVPLNKKDIQPLRIGDIVYFSGQAWTCRSRLQRHIFDEGHKLPFSTDNMNLLIHVGPVVIDVNGKWKLVSFMPTSSIRFEKWGPQSVREFGLRAIIGKTTMGPMTTRAMKDQGCIHATPIGVPVQTFLDCISIQDVHLLDRLGSIEATWILDLKALGPFLVDIDITGQNYFDRLDQTIDENRKKVYARLGIPEDFEYTKLY